MSRHWVIYLYIGLVSPNWELVGVWTFVQNHRTSTVQNSGAGSCPSPASERTFPPLCSPRCHICQRIRHPVPDKISWAKSTSYFPVVGCQASFPELSKSLLKWSHLCLRWMHPAFDNVVVTVHWMVWNPLGWAGLINRCINFVMTFLHSQYSWYE